MENPTDPRQALEVSLTALILGELPSDQAQFLREVLSRDPELAGMHERLKQTIAFVREIEAPASGEGTARAGLEKSSLPVPEPFRLSEKKREKLLQHFKTTPPPVPFVSLPERQGTRWWLVGAAAAVIALLGFAMFLPALGRSKSRSQLAFRTWSLKDQATTSVAPPAPAPDEHRVLVERLPQAGMVSSSISAPTQPRPQQQIVLPRGEKQESAGDSSSFAGFAVNAPQETALTERLSEAAIAGKPEVPAVVSAPPPSVNFSVPEQARVQLQAQASSPPGGMSGGGGGIGGGLPSIAPRAPARPSASQSEGKVRLAFRNRYGLAREGTATPSKVDQNRALPTIDFYAKKEVAQVIDPATGLAIADTESLGAVVDPNTGLPLPETQLRRKIQTSKEAGGRGYATTNGIDAGQWALSTTVTGFYDDKAADKIVAGNRYDQSFTFGQFDTAAKDAGSVNRGAPAKEFKGGALTLGDTPAIGRFFRAEEAKPQAFVEQKLSAGVPIAGLDSAEKTKQTPPAGTERFFAGRGSIELPKLGTEVQKALPQAEPAEVARGRLSESLRDSVADASGRLTEEGKVVFDREARRRAEVEAVNEAVLAQEKVPTVTPRSPRQAQASAETNTDLGSTATSGTNKEVDIALTGITTTLGKAAGFAVAEDRADAIAPKSATAPPVPQPEVDTAENPFSTFSLNVSDVAFKLAAASLEKGVMPEAASIRSEEFINAFDYRDPEAPPGVPIAFAWERSRYPFAQNRDLLRFSLKTAAQGRQAGKPMNLVLLLDNSGSMERADRVTILHEALRVLAAQLQAQDKLSVITFSRTAHLWADGVSGSEAGRVTEEVAGLTPQGGTNLEEAMKLAYEAAARHYLAGGINRVVLLTDGAANLGDVEPETLKKSVEAHRKQGIALDCFGIGWEGYNDDLLEVLSRNGDGRYGFINTPEEASSEFASKIAGALHVAASDVKVQVEFNPARVAAYRQIGYAKHQLTKEQFRDNTVDAAELAAAESGNALYVVEVNPAGQGPLGTVRVRYKEPGTSEYHEHEWTVPYNGSAAALEQATPAMRLAGSASAFAEWLASSPYAAAVSPNALLNLMRGVPQVYGADTRPQKLEWMIQQARSIAGK